MPHVNQYPLERRIKSILDRIHLTRDLINRLEYEKSCDQSDPDCAAKIVKISGPGAGKGTQADYVVRKYHLRHISIGELIRIEIEEETPLGLFVAPIVAAGDLISTDTVLMLLKKEMLNNFLTSKGFLIDGFPATTEQAVRFEKEIGRAHLVIFLNVDDETLQKRCLQRGRSDDQKETVLNRINVFHESSSPLKYEFGKRCKVVSGQVGPFPVWKKVDEVIANSLREWAFTNRDLSGDEVEAVFSAPAPTTAQRQRKIRCYWNMSEIIGGIIPYYMRMNCTRGSLAFAGQSCDEEERKQKCKSEEEIKHGCKLEEEQKTKM